MVPLPNDFKSFSYHYETNNSERVASLVRAGAFENELLQGKPAWSGMHSLTSEPNEGVYQYHLVTKIYLDRPELFDDLFSMLGIFHTAKTARKYAGKFIIIRGSGVADTFIKCGLFGPKSVETVMNGSHYYRGHLME